MMNKRSVHAEHEEERRDREVRAESWTERGGNTAVDARGDQTAREHAKRTERWKLDALDSQEHGEDEEEDRSR